jgi:hypothetical protein
VDTPYRGAKELNWAAKIFTFYESSVSDIAVPSDIKKSLFFYNEPIRSECRHK